MVLHTLIKRDKHQLFFPPKLNATFHVFLQGCSIYYLADIGKLYVEYADMVSVK